MVRYPTLKSAAEMLALRTLDEYRPPTVPASLMPSPSNALFFLIEGPNPRFHPAALPFLYPFSEVRPLLNGGVSSRLLYVLHSGDALSKDGVGAALVVVAEREQVLYFASGVESAERGLAARSHHATVEQVGPPGGGRHLRKHLALHSEKSIRGAEILQQR